MSAEILYKGSTIASLSAGDTISLHLTDQKLTGDLIINADESTSDTDSPLPVEVSTEAEMTALLETAEVGSVYKFTGTSEIYENGALYVVEAVSE